MTNSWDAIVAVLCLLLGSRRHGTLYLGVTSDLVRRIHEHKARTVPGFTAKYGVDRLVSFETYDGSTNAILREQKIKKWRRDWKIQLIEALNPEWRDLYTTLRIKELVVSRETSTESTALHTFRGHE
jgi:putative endonuclease